MSELETPILPSSPPSRFSRFIAWLGTIPADFNAWVADRLNTTRERIVQVELGGLLALGFTLMQIGEWAAAIACWVILACIIFAKALAWQGVSGQKGLTVILKGAYLCFVIAVCVVLITITVLRKPETEPWSNLAKLFRSPPQVLSISGRVFETSVSTVASNPMESVFHLTLKSGPDLTNFQLSCNPIDIIEFSHHLRVGNNVMERRRPFRRVLKAGQTVSDNCLHPLFIGFLPDCLDVVVGVETDGSKDTGNVARYVAWKNRGFEWDGQPVEPLNVSYCSYGVP